MRYAIIGTGSVGGYYGGRLAQSGQEVHFLLNSDYEYVCQHGLRVDSWCGDFLLPQVNAYHQTEDMPQCDVLLVCMKTSNQHLLPRLLAPLLPSDPVVVLIQNGIGVEADLQRQLPSAQIAAGLAFICTTKVGPGHVSHLDFGQLSLGNFSCRGNERLQLLADHLCRAGVKTRLVEYAEARWKKAVWNMPFNGMTVALHSSTDQLLAHPSTRTLIYQQMLEVVAAAQALGVRNIGPDFADKMIATTLKMKPYKPSMRVDYDRHRKMEIDYLYSRGIEMARQAGCAMPRIEMLEQELRFIEATRSDG